VQVLPRRCGTRCLHVQCCRAAAGPMLKPLFRSNNKAPVEAPVEILSFTKFPLDMPLAS